MSSAFEDFKSKRIKIFRNGDIYQLGRKVIVSSKNFRNFEQFLHTASVELSLVTGAARKIYSLEGKRIRKLDELKDNGMYVATSGEAFKRVPYPTTEAAEALVQTKNKTTETNFRLPVDSHKYLSVHREDSDKNDEEEPIFSPSSKAYIVFAYANGDARVQGTRVTLNHRNCRTFRQLLRFLSKTVYQTGGVRKLYDIDTGKQVRRLRDLEDGQNLACSGNDAFKNIKYPLITPVENAQMKKEQELRKVVTFYPNGDSYHTGYVVAILKSRFNKLGKLLDFINSQYRFVAGPIRQIFTTQGKRISKIEHFQNGDNCVLVSGSDPFIHVPYNVNSDEVSPRRQGEYKGLAGSTQHNELMEMIRKPMEPQYSLLFKQQEEAMVAKLTKQHSRHRSMSQSSQASELSEAQRPSKKEKKKKSKKKKKLVVESRIEESEAEEQDQLVQKRAKSLAQRKSKSKKSAQQEEPEEQPEVKVKPNAQSSRVKVNSEPQIFKQSRPVESETEPEESEDDIPEEPLAKVVSKDKNVAYETRVRQFNDQKQPLSDNETAPETSAIEETDAQDSVSDGPDEESEIEVASPKKIVSQKILSNKSLGSQKNLASGVTSPKKAASNDVSQKNLASGVASPKKVASGVVSPKNAASGVTSPKKVASKPELASPRPTKSVRASQKLKSDTEEPTEAEVSETEQETEAEKDKEYESESEQEPTSKKGSQPVLSRTSVNRSQANMKKSQPSLNASETKLNQVTSKTASKKSLPSLIPKSSSNSRQNLQA